MIVTCPRCSSRYRIRDEKVKGRGAKISCPKCEHKFVVQREPEAAAVGGGEGRGVPVTFARGGHPMRRDVTEEDDEADVPTTVMPHGSQVAQQLRAAIEAAQAGHAVTPARVQVPTGDRQQLYDAAVSRNGDRGERTHDDADEGGRSLRSEARSAAAASRGRGLVVAGLVLVAAVIVAAVVGLGAM